MLVDHRILGLAGFCVVSLPRLDELPAYLHLELFDGQDHPEFSPDAKLVLFRCAPKSWEGPSNLYWVHPDGTGLHALTHEEDADKQYLGSSFSPSFSSGEGWITAGRTSGYGDEGNADVFRLLIKDGDVVRSENLTKSAIWDSGPVWGTHPPVG